MRAMRVERFGGPEVLKPAEVPDPVAGPGQAVVAVAVADVLFVEIVIRSGLGGEYFPVRPPYVPGHGVAGQVIAVGEGVDAEWIGRRVAGHARHDGGYAERVAVEAEDLVAVPGERDLPEAAALLHDGITALGLIDSTGVRPGEWVLVTAAAGGLGILLVQLARAAGAKVVAAARGLHKLDLARAHGALVAVDYSEPGWTDRVRDATGGVDVVFDGAGGDIGKAAFDLVVDGGRFSAHGMPAGGFAVPGPDRRGVTVRGIEQVQFAPQEARGLIERALSDERLRPVIGQTFPLEQAAEAHAAIEERAVVGKTLLLP